MWLIDPSFLHDTNNKLQCVKFTKNVNTKTLKGKDITHRGLSGGGGLKVGGP